MVQIPDYDEFMELKKQLGQLRDEISFLKSLLLGQQWLSRSQAMVALKVKKDKLRQLTLSGKIAYRYEGKYPQYEIESIRTYLRGQQFDSTIIDQAILTACSNIK